MPRPLRNSTPAPICICTAPIRMACIAPAIWWNWLGLPGSALSITDHDDMQSVGEAHAAGQELGAEVIAGVELSTVDAALSCICLATSSIRNARN